MWMGITTWHKCERLCVHGANLVLIGVFIYLLWFHTSALATMSYYVNSCVIITHRYILYIQGGWRMRNLYTWFFLKGYIAFYKRTSQQKMLDCPVFGITLFGTETQFGIWVHRLQNSFKSNRLSRILGHTDSLYLWLVGWTDLLL